MIEVEDLKMFMAMQKDPLFFVKKMWNLEPQPVLPEYAEFVRTAPLKAIKAHMFGPFIKGWHITWQQYLFFRAVRKAIQNKGSRKISARSGHGTGKSATLAMLILWFLWCFKNSQVPATAPSSDQLHDILWKELQIWLSLMPEGAQKKFDWSTGYLRVTESPATWFARAKTARKENPEALAGVHADFVMMLVDEASGVAQEIFNTAKGALTNKNILFIMISNPTRLVGYFYDSHHRLRQNWQLLHFNSEESPIVDPEFVATIIRENGLDSDEYRIRVKGEFPKEDSVDDKNYVPLLKESDLRFTSSSRLVGHPKKMGVDPSGEGNDKTTHVIRDPFKAKIAAEAKISSSKSIAQTTITLQVEEELGFRNITVDNFGVGADVGTEVALAVPGARVRAVNVGEPAANKKRFINKRAECFWRLREWLRAGGELVGDLEKWRELLTIRYRRELNGKIKIMSKKEMREEGYKSPNRADALSLTFYDKDPKREKDREEREEEGERPQKSRRRKFDPHSATAY